MVFLQSFMIKLGACGCLHVPETENKTCQISGLKSGSPSSKKFKYWSLTREFYKQYLTEKQKHYFQSGCLTL